MTNTRRDTLAAALQRAGMDAAAIVPGANLRYFTGLHMHMNERLSVAFLGADGTAAVVLPRLEAPRAEAQATIPLRFYPWIDEEGPDAALRQCAADLKLASGRLGVEYTAMRVLELRGIEAAAAGLHAVDATDVFASLRMVKDADELAAMRVAVQIIEDALEQTIQQMRVGMSELAVATMWDDAIKAAGSTPSFSTSVASGPNSANPHHSNSERQLQPGDLVVLDGGALHGGYASDITRTVAIGEPSEEASRIYQLVQAANEAGRAAVRPGASGTTIDQAARAVIANGGYGAQFLHRTGHGLGLEIHEPPYIVAGSDAPLPVGATFTVEPGVYVAGVGGVRIEDDVVVTADGVESLTTFERALIIV